MWVAWRFLEKKKKEKNILKISAWACDIACNFGGWEVQVRVILHFAIVLSRGTRSKNQNKHSSCLKTLLIGPFRCPCNLTADQSESKLNLSPGQGGPPR